MTTIKFLGSGSAFVLADENYQSNILITRNGKTLLYDAGTCIHESLNHFKLTPNDIDNIFISHNHADHSGGMEYIGYKRYFSTYPDVGSNPPKLFGSAPTLVELWDNSLKAGMSRINGNHTTLQSFFVTKHLMPRESFDFDGMNIRPIDITHVVTDTDSMPSQGIMFTDDDTTVFITGDAMFRPDELMEYYELADIIFHDCEMLNYPNSVHAQFHELCTLPEDIKKKMWLYHFSLMGRNIWELENEVISNGFAGIVLRGQEFTTKETTVMEKITLINGNECTKEYYADFCNTIHITPNEFLEMGVKELVVETETLGTLKVTLNDNGIILVEAIKNPNTSTEEDAEC